MTEELSSDRKAAEEAIERMATLVPGSDISFLTGEELRDGYLDLKREHEVLQSERDDLDKRLKDLSQQVLELREQTAAVTASDYTKQLEAAIADLRASNEFLRQRVAAG